MRRIVFVFLGSLFAGLAVSLGAIGAHALESLLTAEQMETYQTAVHYQIIHSIGLLVVGLLSLYRGSRWFDLAGWMMLGGVVLFSGCIYLWLATGQKVFVHLVPIGGTAFILSWLALAIGSLGLRSKNGSAG